MCVFEMCSRFDWHLTQCKENTTDVSFVSRSVFSYPLLVQTAGESNGFSLSREGTLSPVTCAAHTAEVSGVLPILRRCAVVGARLKRDGTRAETRFRLSAKRTNSFKSALGRQFSRLLAAEVFASAVVMLDTPCSEVECKTTGYPLHSHVSPSLPVPRVTECHQVSIELYNAFICFRMNSV